MCFLISLAILTRWILITIYSPHRPNILELSKFYLKLAFGTVMKIYSLDVLILVYSLI